MRRAIALIVVCLVSLTAAGIANAEVQWNVGGKGGLNFANLYGDDVTDNKMFTSFGIGAFTLAEVNQNFGVMGEVFWQRKGAKDETLDEAMKLDYIEVPVSMVVMYPATPTMRMLGFAGPVFSFLTGADFAGTDVKDAFKSSDIGGMVGLGTIFDMGNVNMTLDGRWTFGLTSIADDPTGNTDVKNTNFSVFGGLAVPLH